MIPLHQSYLQNMSSLPSVLPSHFTLPCTHFALTISDCTSHTSPFTFHLSIRPHFHLLLLFIAITLVPYRLPQVCSLFVRWMSICTRLIFSIPLWKECLAPLLIALGKSNSCFLLYGLNVLQALGSSAVASRQPLKVVGRGIIGFSLKHYL